MGCDLVVAAVGWVLVIEVPLTRGKGDDAYVFDCVAHDVLSEVLEVVGFEERDLVGGGTAQRHHVLADVGLQLGAVLVGRGSFERNDKFGHGISPIKMPHSGG